MADPFATYTDVEARWRPLSSAEAAIADQLCADVSSMIRERWPDVDSRVATGSLLAEALTRIVALAVKRAMVSADTEGLESRSQAAGPFSVSDKFSNPNANLFFTAADIELLDGYGFTPRSRVAWLA